MPQRRLPLDDQHGVYVRRRPSTAVDGRKRAWCEWAFTLNFSGRWFLFSQVSGVKCEGVLYHITAQQQGKAAETGLTSRLLGNYRSLTVKPDRRCRNSNSDGQIFNAVHAHACRTIMFYSSKMWGFSSPKTYAPNYLFSDSQFTTTSRVKREYLRNETNYWQTEVLLNHKECPAYPANWWTLAVNGWDYIEFWRTPALQISHF